jgi:DNA-binding transcriptional MerR regulator/methylmalonyl-CoA mutase cobalamin-binding subunit
MTMATKGYPIQIVARRTGLNVELLRAWERRYGAVEPKRSEGGRRLYSAADIERLSLLGRAVERGLRIGDACRLDDDGLRSFRAESASAAQPELADASASPTTPATARTHAALSGLPLAASQSGTSTFDSAAEAEHLAACQRAIEAFDPAGLARALARATVELSLRALVDAVIAPLLTWIGDRWSAGSLCVAQEHMASTAVRSALLADLEAGPAGRDAPCIIVTTPALELHELGALLAARAAAAAGWRVEYLGPNLPASEIAVAARHLGAAAVALSIARPGKDPALVGDLEELRRLLPKKTAILLGGAGAAAYADALGKKRVQDFQDCWSFAEHLKSKAGAAR